MWLENNAQHTYLNKNTIPNSEGVYFYTQGKNNNNVVKIGCSRDVRTRLHQHQSSSLDKIEIRMMLEVGDWGEKCGYDYKRLEKIVHGVASEYGTHMRGEWYKIDSIFLWMLDADVVCDGWASVFYLDCIWMEEIIEEDVYQVAQSRGKAL